MPRLLLCLAIILLGSMVSSARAQFTDPTSSELLGQLPYDNLTLIDNTVLKIEPISPRPIPSLSASRSALENVPGRRDNVFLPGQGSAQPREQPKKQDKKKKRNLDVLIIHLTEGDIRDFKVKRASIKSVEYWEDMLLAEGERLVAVKNFSKAFEYYLAVQARNPHWKGLREHVDDLLFQEGSWALSDNERDRGIRLLTELYHRRPDYPGLANVLARAFATRVEEAVSNEDYAYGRKILHDLQTIAPSDSQIRVLTNRFQTRARDLASQAERTAGAERLDNLTHALRVWPTLEGAAQPFENAFRELPTLDVGVLDVPRPVAPWIRSPASKRITPLLYRPILLDESEEALLGEPAGQIAASVELGDLGRRLEIRLKRGIRWSDDTRSLSTIDIVRALSDRAQPRSPSYNARWANLLERIETPDADAVTVRLNRAPVSPQIWLTVPVGPAHASWDGRVSINNSDERLPVGDAMFVFDSGSDDSLTLLATHGGRQAARGEPAPVASESEAEAESKSPAPPSGTPAVTSRLPDPKILRIKEVRLKNADEIMHALERGEISLMEHVPADRVATLALMNGIQWGHYRLPSLHSLAVDGRNPLLQSRSLRRAIAYAIDRKALLEEKVLRHKLDEVNLPSDGAFTVESYANAPGVEPLDYNILLSKMLVAAAQRELSQSKFKFTLEYPSIPEAQTAAPEIADMLKKVGIDIELIERSPTELEQGLRAGRRFDLAYRINRCSEPVYQVGSILCPGYDAPPDSAGLASLASPRITQLLLELEHAPEWVSARQLVTRIDREVRDELPIIPLWQLQDHYAWRDRLKGPQEVMDNLYQNIETWEIAPWFARDPW